MKILILHKRLLFPANTGGKIRTLDIVRHLAKWHEVTYLCNLLPEEEPYLEQMRDLGVELVTVPWSESPRDSLRFYVGLAQNLFSRFPYSVNKDFDPRLCSKLESLIQQGNFDLLICDFVQTSRNAFNVSGLPRLLFQHNVEAQVYRRMAESEPRWLRRWYITGQYRKMAAFEQAAGRVFQKVVAVSARDAETFRNDYGWEHVSVIDTAVDTEYFRPIDTEKVPGKLVFVGSMDWLPNQQGVLRFVRNILPKIQEHYPEATLDIVGRRPPKEIQRLRARKGVYVTGSVEDVRPYIARAEVAVVPLYAGGGTRLKIFEFMAMGVPVVSTRLGAEGLSVQPGEHWNCADDDRDFARVIQELLGNAEERQRLAVAALGLVRQAYSSEIIARQFDTICREVVNSR